MNPTLRLPKERVLALDPAAVEAYLLAHGWEADRRASSREAGVYHLPAAPNSEILVSRDRTFIDYALRMAEALQAVAAAEGRTAWEVLNGLGTAGLAASANGPAAGSGAASGATSRSESKRNAS
jgi:hypothetical protein